MQQRLEKIFKECFDLTNISDCTSIENVRDWDSMAHVGLMLALQKEFGVSISPAQAIELTDVAGIKKFLEKNGIK